MYRYMLTTAIYAYIYIYIYINNSYNVWYRAKTIVTAYGTRKTIVTTYDTYASKRFINSRRLTMQPHKFHHTYPGNVYMWSRVSLEYAILLT